MIQSPLRIFVGWDSREDIAFQVCRSSLQRYASLPLEIVPIKQAELRNRGLYRRAPDPLASTEFTYTRFLVPTLAGFSGWALFCDCDFLWQADVTALFSEADERYAVMCVKHDHRPPEASKMDGRVQTLYPRKNWSSLALYNCGHQANRALSAEVVNREPGSFLHQFRWLSDDLIGGLPGTWNWLEGWDAKPAHGVPNAIHYTRGGPWFDNWRHVSFAEQWQAEYERIKKRSNSIDQEI